MTNSNTPLSRAALCARLATTALVWATLQAGALAQSIDITLPPSAGGGGDGVPYTGATGAVDLGTNSLTAGAATFGGAVRVDTNLARSVTSALLFGDGDSGIRESGADDQLRIFVGGAGGYRDIIIRDSVFYSERPTGFYIRKQTYGVNDPVYSTTGDIDTGLGSQLADTLDLITHGTNRLTIADTVITSTVPLVVEGAVTASGNAYNDPAFKLGNNTGIYGTDSLVYVAVGHPSKLYSFQQDSFSTGGASGWRLQANVGVESAPAYSSNGDMDTGMYFPAANQLGFSTHGTNRLTIADDGATFAGAASFGGAVDVIGGLSVQTNQAGTASEPLRLYETPSKYVQLLCDGDGQGQFRSFGGGNSSWAFFADTYIGDSSIYVSESAGAPTYLQLYADNAGGIINALNGQPLLLQVDEVNKLTVTSTAITSTVPLTVNGAIDAGTNSLTAGAASFGGDASVSGELLVGTTTDAGAYQLQVDGATRLAGTTTIDSGSGANTILYVGGFDSGDKGNVLIAQSGAASSHTITDSSADLKVTSAGGTILLDDDTEINGTATADRFIFPLGDYLIGDGTNLFYVNTASTTNQITSN